MTGTSVLAVTYKGGVALTADTLGSYGKMSRFWNMSRLRPISTNTLLGASGDISDFQSVLDDLERARVEDVCAEDGAFLSTSEISSWLSRVTYQRRNKMNFLWNTFVVAGVTEKNEAYLSVVDKLGTSYQEKFAATGFGAHLALPLLRERWNPNLTKDEAKKLLEDCMRVLYYRDCRTINRIQFGTLLCVYCSRENSLNDIVLYRYGRESNRQGGSV